MERAASASEVAPRVVAVAASALLVAAARLAIAAILLGVTLPLAGRHVNRALGGFTLGTAFLAFGARVDRRGLLLRRERTPEPLPADARLESAWRVALGGLLPSTAVLVAMAAIALATGNSLLGAILAGAVGGLGLAAALSWLELAALESRDGARLYVERGPRGRHFARPMPGAGSATAPPR